MPSPDTSDADKKKSPGGSPLRRKNATRVSKVRREDNVTPGSGLTTSGDDFPDGGEDSFQFRRRSSAMRSRPKSPSATNEVEPAPEGGRSRTRSRAISGMQRPIRRPVRGRQVEAKSRGQGDLDEEFQRVSPRPRSQSPTPDGEPVTRL